MVERSTFSSRGHGCCFEVDVDRHGDVWLQWQHALQIRAIPVHGRFKAALGRSSSVRSTRETICTSQPQPQLIS
jgi:hypothetical protein